MAHKRSLMAGFTDYTGVSFEDICSDLKNWLSNTEETIKLLLNYRSETQKQHLLENPEGVISFIEYFIDLFSRYKNDLQRLVNEIPNGVSTAHVEIVSQLYKSSRHEDSITVKFAEDYVHKPLLHEEVRPLLDDIYGDTRNLLIDYYDLSNLLPRLKTFIRSYALSSEALPDLHLKPNFFGVGLNINKLFGRVRDWWRSKKR